MNKNYLLPTPESRVAVVLAALAGFIASPVFFGTLLLAAMNVHRGPWPLIVYAANMLFQWGCWAYLIRRIKSDGLYSLTWIYSICCLFIACVGAGADALDISYSASTLLYYWSMANMVLVGVITLFTVMGFIIDQGKPEESSEEDK